jgi:hypothetical protein
MVDSPGDAVDDVPKLIAAFDATALAGTSQALRDVTFYPEGRRPGRK